MEIFATVANPSDKDFASKAIKDRLLQVLSGKIHSLGNFSVGGLVIPGIFIEGVDIAHNISIENNQLYKPTIKWFSNHMKLLYFLRFE